VESRKRAEQNESNEPIGSTSVVIYKIAGEVVFVRQKDSPFYSACGLGKEVHEVGRLSDLSPFDLA